MSVSRLRLLILPILLHAVLGNSSDDVEDITAEHSFRESDDFPLPPSLTHSLGYAADLSKNNNILRNYFEKKREKSKDTSNEHIYRQSAGSASLERGFTGYEATKHERSSSFMVTRDTEEDRQVIAGIPDLNDPCFRRYANCIIVNAQPYERRSSLSLLHCKSYCLHKQTGAYSCRSFVYDNINQVCDLFAHVGDQAPARLLKFQSRDYFEPTHAYQCIDYTTLSSTTTTQPSTTENTTIATLPVKETEITMTTAKEQAIVHASKVDSRQESIDVEKAREPQGSAKAKSSDEDFAVQSYCPTGKKVSFLRTEGFELYNNDDITTTVTSVGECVTACERNEISGQTLDCRSFDYFTSTCAFTSETAVPLGNGQLKQRNDSYYYEKICVAESLISICSPTFTRFPQMVLVGFAEAVADATSFETCFEYCLDSYARFGFNCSSGMYFFEEAQLNCILNSEDRHTQRDLFTEENTDIVDYFEVGCQKPRHQPRMRSARTYVVPNKLVIAEETQTEWSNCEDGLQHRRKDCNEPKHCGMESRNCNELNPVAKSLKNGQSTRNEDELPTPEDIAKVKADVRAHGLRCRPDVCCPVFKGCTIGLRMNSKMKRLEWCKKPCVNKRNYKL